MPVGHCAITGRVVMIVDVRIQVFRCPFIVWRKDSFGGRLFRGNAIQGWKRLVTSTVSGRPMLRHGIGRSHVRHWLGGDSLWTRLPRSWCVSKVLNFHASKTRFFVVEIGLDSVSQGRSYAPIQSARDRPSSLVTALRFATIVMLEH